MLIEVVVAGTRHAISKSYSIDPPATVGDALARAMLDPAFAGVDFAAAVGVFGRIARVDAPLRDGDRVEIYRPLREAPKSARRRRAAAASRSVRS